ncbi:MAG: gliding motility-associated C-terminal domain-containing protein [Bacteroidia bacterium]
MPYRIFLFLLIILGSLTLHAKHLVGGDITYRCLGGNQYEITLNVYRDCSTGTVFDDDVALGIYDGGTLAKITNFVLSSPNIQKIQNTVSDPCVDVSKLPNLCYERAIYKRTTTLPSNQNGYYITWGRCCRNNSILNIIKPGDVGMALYAFIPANTFTCNSSPSFKNSSPTFICLNDVFEFDQSATDADGDSLYYVLTPPFTAASPDTPVLQIGPRPNFPFPSTPTPSLNLFDLVNWNTGFSTNNPIGGNPILTIHPNTGQLKVRPQTLGQFVFSVSVYEFRNGTFLSEVKRDIQINVINCPINFPPEITVEPSPQIQGDTIFFNLGEESCFNLTGTDVNGLGVDPDNLTMTISGDVFSGSTFAPPYATLNANTGLSPIGGQLCWTPDCNQTNMQGTLYVTISDNNDCPGPNVVTDTFVVILLPGASTPPDLRCVSVENNTSIKLTWINPQSNRLAGFEHYVIERDDGTGWTALTQINDSTINTFTDNTVVNANTIPYKYRLSTAKTCPNFFVGGAGNEVTSMVASAVTLNEAQTRADWNAYKNVNFPVTYTVIALDTPNIVEFIAGQNVTDTFFVHNACHFLGSYRIRVTDPVTGCEAYSGRSNDVSADNQPVQPSDVCVVTGDSLAQGNLIKWYPFNGPDFGKYQVYRKRSDESFFSFLAEVNNVNTTFYLDTEADVNNFSYCYLVKMIDVCNLEFETVSDCSIVLQTSKTGFSVNLAWTPYTGWGNDIYTYNVYYSKEGKTMSLIASNLNSSTLSFDDINVNDETSKYCYRIEAVKANATDCANSFSNESCQIFEPTLFSPTAFSPNGDGINDEFIVEGAFHQSYEMIIYDRWGKVLFTSKSARATWDGKSNGKDVPEGVYAYFVKAVGETGKVMQRSGTITLIR